MLILYNCETLKILTKEQFKEFILKINKKYKNISKQNIKDINPTPYKTIANLINSIAGKYIKENY